MQNQIINENVLVLNKFLLAFQVVRARDAICALVAGRALVVDQNYNTYNWTQWIEHSRIIHVDPELKRLYSGYIKSPSIMIYLPQVIQLHSFDTTKELIRNVRFSRKNVVQRDNYTCAYCNKKFDKKDLTMDHIIPRSKGGMNTWNNVVTCCKKCNSIKGDKLLSQLGWELKQKPKAPQWKSHIKKKFSQMKKEYWQMFLKQEIQ